MGPLLVLTSIAACATPGEPVDRATVVTFVGEMLPSVPAQAPIQAVLQLEIRDTTVAGSLAMGERVAAVAGTVRDTTLTAGITFVEGCLGTFTTIGRFVRGKSQLIGEYEGTDCTGHSAGSYQLIKQ